MRRTHKIKAKHEGIGVLQKIKTYSKILYIMSIISYIFVFYCIYLASAIGILTLRNFTIKTWSHHDELLTVLISIMLSACFSLIYGALPVTLFSILFITIVLLAIGKFLFKNYSYAGINFYLANLLMTGVGLIWGVQFMATLHVSLMTKLLLFSTSPLLILTLPLSVVQMVEKFDILCREKWNRPRKPAPISNLFTAPMVSLHVPTHSEPPEIVIETLNKIAKLHYANYEVLVIDNNTADEKLWMPLKKHCEKLGDKFRFFHLENLKGAKAGALNFAITQTNQRASLIAVIDADYHTEPEFLKELVGHFEDSTMGFVQTPHDYRDWKKSIFLTMCYWEYKIFFHSILIALNERGAGITVGTMCIIRKQALLDAGGWSEWCVTEDSELAIRIHDAGYSSAYVNKTYGRGLIPETFEAYKKQRYRWTAGPVQELTHHFKHYVGLSKKPSKFSLQQRVHHFNHGMNNVIIGLSIPLTISSFALITSMVMHREVVAVPFELWLAATISLGSTLLLDWLIYKVTINPSLKEILGKILASKALQHVITYAAFRTLVTGSAAWNRTSKFKVKHSYKSALYATKEESTIALLLIGFIIISYNILPYTGLVLMLLIGIAYTALSYLAAPIISMINVWTMKKQQSMESSDSFSIPYIPTEQFFYPVLSRNRMILRNFLNTMEDASPFRKIR
jgi:cellulose synthase/poly-beta-1,6-N-acetylglucosamine synthase-like glycosyltransferase